MVIVGGGRVGRSLARLAAERGVACTLRTRGEPPVPSEWSAGTPLLVAVRNDDLTVVVDAVPESARPDLVFVQNGMLRPWLAERGLHGNTRGLLFFSASERGGPIVDGGGSPFTGSHAPTVVAWFRALGLGAVAVDRSVFAEAELEKLVWNCVFGLLSELHAVPVGAVVDTHRDAFDALSAELIGVGARALGLHVDVAAMQHRLVAYTLSIAAYRGAVREWPWRNGWFVEEAARQGGATPVHAALLAAAAARRPAMG